MIIDGHPTGRQRTRSLGLMTITSTMACREGLICHNRSSRQRGHPRGRRPQTHSRHLQASTSIVMPHMTLSLGNAPPLSIVIVRQLDVAYRSVSQRKETGYVFIIRFGIIKLTLAKRYEAAHNIMFVL